MKDETELLKKMLKKCGLKAEIYADHLLGVKWNTKCFDNLEMKLQLSQFKHTISVRTAFSFKITENKMHDVMRFITMCNNINERNWFSLDLSKNLICVHSVATPVATRGFSLDYKNMKKQLYLNMLYDIECIDFLFESLNSIINDNGSALGTFWHYEEFVDSHEKKN